MDILFFSILQLKMGPSSESGEFLGYSMACFNAFVIVICFSYGFIILALKDASELQDDESSLKSTFG